MYFYVSYIFTRKRRTTCVYIIFEKGEPLTRPCTLHAYCTWRTTLKINQWSWPENILMF